MVNKTLRVDQIHEKYLNPAWCKDVIYFRESLLLVSLRRACLKQGEVREQGGLRRGLLQGRELEEEENKEGGYGEL